MKAIGGLLLILGVIGLLLNLILWLPAGFNLIVMVLISVVCFVAICGGGRLSQTKIEVAKERATKYETTAQATQEIRQKIACPRCGWLGASGQRFCGACGSSLAYCCPTCGASIAPESKFCPNCGARLG
ncbi:MAG: zinc-ribbon domain-containing protein [Chloroflexi bacterium]|nr:zinc-ribbon domain-containing protein [Chloroflexota bacterium]